MAMSDQSAETRIEVSGKQHGRWSPKGRQVRLVLMTWRGGYVLWRRDCARPPLAI